MSFSQESDPVRDNLYKFDDGFYEKIRQMQNVTSYGRAVDAGNATLPTHSVIIVTDDGHEDGLERTLKEMGSRDIFKSRGLGFLIADVPVSRIADLAGYDHVYKLGDGRGELTLSGVTLEQAKAVVGATNLNSTSYPYTGAGVTVGLIDDGTDFTHPDLQNKGAASIACSAIRCTNTSLAGNDHATGISAIIASNSTNSTMVGVAPDSMIYDVRPSGIVMVGEDPVEKATFARALDELMTNDITVALSSRADNTDFGCNNYSALTIVIDRAVHEGLSFSMAIGNIRDNRPDVQLYIQSLACGFNYINVGAVDKNRTIWIDSARGPAQFNIPSGDVNRIKPEITAIGVDLELAVAEYRRNHYNRDHMQDNGTSFANAFVAGASALILEKQPDYRPLEIKAALLAGADWQANVPATAADYDNQVTGIYDTMNQYGFGILNIERSLDYANDDDHPNVLHDQSSSNFAANSYRIHAEEGERVKVLLSWLIHPGGSVLSPTLPINSPHVQLPNQYHNYDLAVEFPDGTARRSDSDVQNNEFVVFDAPETGFYTITVRSDGTLIVVPGEPYVLASTHGIDKFPYDVDPPVVPVTTFSDDFQSDLSKWVLSGDSDWEIGDPDEDVPGEDRRTNLALVSRDCDSSCIATISDTFDTRNPLTVAFDRFVDSVDADEGLFVEYSTDGTVWTALASYTQDNNEDDESWHGESLSLDIEEDTAKIRFVAKSNTRGEPIEIDNVGVGLTVNGGGGPPNPTPVPDTTAPVITSPGDLTAEATGVLTAVSIGQATATDNRDPSPDITNDAPDAFPVGATTVTWTATDDAGNSSTATQTVTVRDTTPPTVTAPTAHTAEATGVMTALGTADYGTATATDLADPDPEITSDAPDSFQLGDTAITWTATDDGGNSATATQTITVRDTTPPDITPPAAHTAEATGVMTALDADDYGTATATDLVDSDPEITSDAPDSFPLGTTTITWTATDDGGNSATATQTVTVHSTSVPIITAPADHIAEATAALTPLDATDYGTATATDLVDPDPEITSDAPDEFPLGDTIITWTATNDAGNSATADQIVTIRDTTPPAVTAPDSHTAEATGVMTALDADDYGTATATDLVDSDPEITSDAPDSFPLGTTTITWTATDDGGNSETAAQTITVRDTAPPVIAAPPDIEVVVPQGSNATVYFAVPEATDLADPDVDVSCAPASGSVFRAGSTAVACTATDDSGNESGAGFDVRVTEAVGRSVFLHDFEAGGLSGELVGWTESGGPRWHAAGPAERINPPGSPAHNRVAQANGCTSECIMTLSSPVDMTRYDNGTLAFHRFVDDGLGPSEYLRLDAFDGSSWVQLDRWTPEDSDDDNAWHRERYQLDAYTEAEAFKIRFVAKMGSPNEYVAVDDVMLTATRAADAEPPVITAPLDAAFEATAPLTPLDVGDYGTATATDGSGAPPAVTSDAPGSFPVGDTVITWTATDASGNTAYAAQTVTVRDTTPPAFAQVPGDMAVLTHHGRDAEVVFAPPVAGDTADPDVAVSCTPESGAGFPVGSTTVTCTATDDSGNESQASFEVRVGSSEATATVSRTVTGEGATWTVAGPAVVFAGGTYEYTVTLESGTRPLNEALAIYGDTSTVDDFGQYADGAGCPVAFCAGFPGQAGDPYELDNHGGSPYDIRYRTVGAAGPGHVITLQTGGQAPAGSEVTVGLMDRHGGPRGGVQVTVVDPAAVSTLGRQLVSHLAFEGDTQDSAGGSHGAVNGTARYVDGAIGRAFHFDGSTYITLAGAGRFDFGTADPFTLSLWFKKDGPDAMRSHILAKQDTRADPGLFMWIWPGFPTRIQTGINDGEAFAGVNTLRDVNVTDGTWRHVAVTYDGSGLRDGFTAYVDGHDSSDRRMALRLDGAGTNEAPVTLGALGTGHDRLHEAAVDELRIYSRELTAREVFELYAAGTG